MYLIQEGSLLVTKAYLRFFVSVVYDKLLLTKGRKKIDLAVKCIANVFYCYIDCQSRCTLEIAPLDFSITSSARSNTEFFEVP